MDAGERLATLTAADLAPVVRQALLDAEAWPETWNWSAPSWSAFSPSTRGLYRLHGSARLRTGAVSPWVVVLKVVGAVQLPGFVVPDDIFYWRREALALSWDQLSSWDGPFVPVRLLGVEDVTEDEQWLWLESLDDSEVKPRWRPQQHAAAAHDLGAFSAKWSASRPTADALPWLSERWLRGWVTYMDLWGASLGVNTPAYWEHPRLAAALPATTRARVVELMSDSERILSVLEALPVTLAHHDAQWRNTFQAGGRTVAVDWSCLGLAPVGADLGHLIGCDVEHWAVPPSQARRHDAETTAAYLRGLRDFGWRGDERVVRFARAASAALQIVPLCAAQVCWLHGQPEEIGAEELTTWPENLAQKEGLAVEKALAGWAEVFTLMLDLGDEGRGLADQLH